MSVLFPTALHNVNELIVSDDEVTVKLLVNITLGEDQIPVSFTLEPNW